MSDMGAFGHTYDVLGEVANERVRQDEKWGEQNHPLLTPNYPEDSRRFYYEESILWKKANADRVESGTLAWDGILLEEIHEALGEESFMQRRQELIQAAAVIVAMVECMDRDASRSLSPSDPPSDDMDRYAAKAAR